VKNLREADRTTRNPPDADIRTLHRTELSHRHSLRVTGRAQPHHSATELTKAMWPARPDFASDTSSDPEPASYPIIRTSLPFPAPRPFAPSKQPGLPPLTPTRLQSVRNQLSRSPILSFYPTGKVSSEAGPSRTSKYNPLHQGRSTGDRRDQPVHIPQALQVRSGHMGLTPFGRSQ
jgi:hypothetical protein